jgi:hypothetical protein
LAALASPSQLEISPAERHALAVGGCVNSMTAPREEAISASIDDKPPLAVKLMSEL